jgi:four helix bundle protein
VPNIGKHAVQKSDADFVSKIEGALQELDETDYWIEILTDGNYLPTQKLESLKEETDELISILVTIVRKVKARRK